MLPSSRAALFRLQNHVSKFATCSSTLKVSGCRWISQNVPPSPPEDSQSKGPSSHLPDKFPATPTTTPTMTVTSPLLPSSPEDETSGLDKLYKTLELEVLSYEPSILDSYQWFVMTSAKHLGIPVGKVWSPLKSDKDRFPLLKSAFVHKKHQVHYEIRTYHRFITLHHLTSSTATTFLEYIQRNLPEGCGLKVTKVMVQPVPKFLIKSGLH